MSTIRFVPILALAAALASPLSAGAQTMASPAPDASSAPMMSGHHHRHHRQSLMHQLEALNLSAAQKQQVATFHSQEQQANQNADAATKRANASKMRSQIMGILTPDQKTQLQSHMHHGSGMNSDSHMGAGMGSGSSMGGGMGSSPAPNPAATPKTR